MGLKGPFDINMEEIGNGMAQTTAGAPAKTKQLKRA